MPHSPANDRSGLLPGILPGVIAHEAAVGQGSPPGIIRRDVNAQGLFGAESRPNWGPRPAIILGRQNGFGSVCEHGQHAPWPFRIEPQRKNLPMIESRVGILEMLSPVVARKNAQLLGADQDSS